MENGMANMLTDAELMAALKNRKSTFRKIEQIVSNMSKNNFLLDIEKAQIIKGYKEIYRALPENNFQLSTIFLQMITELTYYPMQSYPNMLEHALDNFFSDPQIREHLQKYPNLVILPGGYSENEIKSYSLIAYMFKSNLFKYIVEKNNIEKLSVTILVNPPKSTKDTNDQKDAQKIGVSKKKETCFLIVDDYSSSGSSMEKAINTWSESLISYVNKGVNVKLNILSLIIEEQAYDKLSQSHNVYYYKKTPASSVKFINNLANHDLQSEFVNNSMNIMIRTPNNTPLLIHELPPFKRLITSTNNIEKWKTQWKNTLNIQH